MVPRLQGILLLFSLTLMVFLSSNLNAAPSSADSKFSAKQKSEIEQIMRQYLMDNPDILIEMSQKLQQQQEVQTQQQASKAVSLHAKELFASSGSPTAGAKNGTVRIVEFLDYQCGHCKRMADVMSNLIKANPHVQVIFKELPLFGPISEYAARAALASQKQGKFLVFHRALLKASRPLTEKKVMSIAKQIGLNTEELLNDMNSTAINKQIDDNEKLADALGIGGTPVYIIAPNPIGKNGKQAFFIPGGVPQSTMQNVINQIQKK